MTAPGYVLLREHPTHLISTYKNPPQPPEALKYHRVHGEFLDSFSSTNLIITYNYHDNSYHLLSSYHGLITLRKLQDLIFTTVR